MLLLSLPYSLGHFCISYQLFSVPLHNAEFIIEKKDSFHNIIIENVRRQGLQKILIKGVECARAKARPLGGLGACSPRKILKFRSSEIDSSAFLRKKCDE